MSRKYTCSAEPGCKQTFTKFTVLKRHKAAHSAQAYTCTWPGCNFATLLKKSYDIHCDKHAGEQRWICPHDDCDYKTHDPSCLTCHRKTKHGHVPPAQRYCMAMFMRLGNVLWSKESAFGVSASRLRERPSHVEFVLQVEHVLKIYRRISAAVLSLSAVFATAIIVIDRGWNSIFIAFIVTILISFSSIICTGIVDGKLKDMNDKEIKYPFDRILFITIIWHVLAEIALLHVPTLTLKLEDRISVNLSSSVLFYEVGYDRKLTEQSHQPCNDGPSQLQTFKET
ncbi:hypothetical protein BDR04DRAFT_1143859 [Suillus decipiens]|nr:hypothetical protein BDR04DRAFT_1143859 [Suillus decipiens]